MAKPLFGKKNVLVIGGAGFLGSHLSDDLVKSCRVICLDNFSTGAEHNIDHLLANPNFVFIKHDITFPFSLKSHESGLEQFKAPWQGVQEVYFLASPSSRGDVERLPIETMMVNAIGLRHALDLSLENQARFCYVSSEAVYGDFPDPAGHIPENYEGAARHIDNHGCYGVAQRFGEALVEAYRRNKGLDVRVARVFNTYGPRMGLMSSRIIAEYTRKALTEDAIVVYGGSESIGSFCFVSDTVKGLRRLMDAGDEQPVNIGNDEAVRLVDLAAQIKALTGSSAKLMVHPGFPDGYRHEYLPDITRAKETLSWFPVVLLRDGLVRTVDDLKASHGLIEPGTEIR